MARTLLTGLIKFIRYRFLLFAGCFPYFLGTAVASYSSKEFSLSLFLIGLLGIFLVLIGVEALNEFFDWQSGTDLVFQLNPKGVPKRKLLVGSSAFFFAFVVAIFLTLKVGIAIIIFSIIGFFAALFYLSPPVKLAYRGLGELSISLSYGPFMVMGSYYLQTQRIETLPLFVSLIPALLIFAISILNEVPDYFQDRLVGKRNICVRIGQKNVIRLYGVILGIFYAICLIGVFLRKEFPPLTLLIFVCLPLSVISYIMGLRRYNNSYKFLPVIRFMIIQYTIAISIFILAYLL